MKSGIRTATTGNYAFLDLSKQASEDLAYFFQGFDSFLFIPNPLSSLPLPQKKKKENRWKKLD